MSRVPSENSMQQALKTPVNHSEHNESIHEDHSQREELQWAEEELEALAHLVNRIS